LVTVRYFAAAREATGRGEEALVLPAGATVADAVASVTRTHPALAGLAPTLRVAVGERFAPREAALADGDTVALLPPVSGG
jgi:molybdopterin converting factor subunit 1